MSRRTYSIVSLFMTTKIITFEFTPDMMRGVFGREHEAEQNKLNNSNKRMDTHGICCNLLTCCTVGIKFGTYPQDTFSCNC